MISCEVKWQNPDGGPFHRAQHQLLRMLLWHRQWQHLFSIHLLYPVQWLYSIFPTVFSLSLSRSVCFTIKKKHLVSPVFFHLYPHGGVNAFAFLGPPLGLTSSILFYPYLSAQKGPSAGFVICCKRFSRHTIACISSRRKNVASSPVTQSYGCIKYPCAAEVLTFGSLKGRRAFHAFEGVQRFTIIPQKIVLSCQILSLYFDREHYRAQYIRNQDILSSLCNRTAGPMNI